MMQPSSVRHNSNGSPPARRIVVFLALLATCLVFIPFMPVMPSPGLDPSWRFALNIAVEKGYVFGRDLIFTFGPLGSVYSVVYSPATDLMMLLASALYAAGFVISIHLSAVGRRQWWAIVLPLLICLFVLRDVYFLSMPFFLLLAVLRVTQPPGSAYKLRPTRAVIAGVVVATVAMGVGPVVKGSFSGVVLPVGGLIFLVLLFSNVRAAVGFVVLGVIGAAGSWVLSGQSLADLPRFFIAQGPIISGYTNAMSLGGDAETVGYFLLGAIIVFGAFSWALWRTFGPRSLFACVAMAFTLFISFKAGFVRQDGHVFIATGVLLLLAYGTALFARPFIVAVVWAAALLTWAVVGSSVFDINRHFIAEKISENWGNAYRGIHTRLAEPGKLIRDYDEALNDIRKEYPLPPTEGTVDIYPTELSAVFANGLNWSGRPVPQSYSAYDPILDAKNVAHLKSVRAPGTVFFSLATIDGRLPTLDDSGSVLELLAGYAVEGVAPPYVIMKMHAGDRGAELDNAKREEKKVSFGETIELQGRQPLWMQLDIKPTLLGKAVGMLFRLPQVQIEIVLDNGTSFRKRIIPKMAEVGFIVSPYLESPSDMVNLAAGIDFGAKVKAVRIYTEGTGLWQSSFDVSVTPIKITPQKSARALILNSPSSAPAALMASKAGGTAQCTIDSVNGAKYQPGLKVAEMNGIVQLQGWIAPARPDDDSPMQVWGIVQRDGAATTYYKANMMSRPDVATALKRPQLVNSGFTLGIDFSDESGVKTISLMSEVDGQIFGCEGLSVAVQDR